KTKYKKRKEKKENVNKKKYPPQNKTSYKLNQNDNKTAVTQVLSELREFFFSYLFLFVSESFPVFYKNAVASDVIGIRSNVAMIKSDLNALTLRLTSVESRVEVLESGDVDKVARIDRLEEDIAYQSRFTSDLWDRLQDLENRSRRNNIRVLGVPEGSEEGFPSGPAFLMSLLQEILQLEPGVSFEIERALRSLGPRPGFGQRPRLIIARFLRFLDRNKVLQLSRGKGELTWRRGKVMIFPDMSPELAALRHQFIPVRRKCISLGLKYAIQYSALLQILVGGQNKNFADPEEALAFLNTVPPAEEGPRNAP
uniref:L1 transposable element RRM domain-containing protein n=1 Tax=Latimeria chalumnae TaxID=7897 RepID=H3AG89_LATCH